MTTELPHRPVNAGDAKTRTVVVLPSGKSGTLMSVRRGRAKVRLQSGAWLTVAAHTVHRAPKVTT